jgi:hypothetical protein
MARGCTRIDSRLDTAKIGSDGRVEVHRARLLAVFRDEKRFHTAWVIRDRVEPATNPAMSVMLPKAEERYGFARPATRAGAVPANRYQ